MQIGALPAECVCNLLRINTHSHEHGKVGEYFTSLKIKNAIFKIVHFTCHKFIYGLLDSLVH